MPKCPNCGRETLRTEDWACQWCGNPLLSDAFKKIDKTYRQLQEERGYKPGPGPEDETEPAPVAEVEAEPAPSAPEPKPAAPPEPEPQPPPMPEPEPEIEPETPEPSEPAAEVEAEAKTEGEIEPTAELEGEAVAEEKPVAEPELVAAAEVEAEPEPEQVAEIEAEAEVTPAAKPKAAPTLKPDKATGIIDATVEELNAAFNSDKSGTNNKLMNKILQVTGTVDKVFARDNLDIFYIILGGAGGRVTWQVRCSFSREHGAHLSRLTEGQTATVRGTYIGYERNVILKDCSLVQ